MNIYYVPGIVTIILSVKNHLIFTQTYVVGLVINATLQLRKLKDGI